MMNEHRESYTVNSDSGFYPIGCEPVFNAVLDRLEEFIFIDLLQEIVDLPDRYHEGLTVEELFAFLTDDQLFGLHSKVTKEYLAHSGSHNVGVGGVGLEIIKQERDRKLTLKSTNAARKHEKRLPAGTHYCHPHFVPFGMDFLDDVTQSEILILGLNDFILALNQLTQWPLSLFAIHYLYAETDPIMAKIAVRKLGFQYLKLGLTDKIREVLNKPMNQLFVRDDFDAIFAQLEELQDMVPNMEKTLQKLLQRFARGDVAEFLRNLRIKAIIKLIRELDNDRIIRDVLA